MLNTKEHYDLIDQFEKDCKPGRLDKEPKDLWPKGIVYQDGRVNEWFLMYRQGYAYGKAVGLTAVAYPLPLLETAETETR